MNTTASPAVAIPVIALSTEMILTPIPITFVSEATTAVPAVETTSPTATFAVAIPLIDASNASFVTPVTVAIPKVELVVVVDGAIMQLYHL